MSILSVLKTPRLGSLRARLVFASLSLATVVSLISIIVAVRLSNELGRSTELRAIQQKSDILLSQIALTRTHETRQIIFNGLTDSAHSNNLMTGTRIIIDGVKVFQHGINTAMSQRIKLLDLSGKSHSGSIEISDSEYIWTYQAIDQPLKASVLLIHYPESLDQALQLVTKRLSLTAFITFWLSVWSALLVSSFIVKQVRESNKKLTHMATHDALTDLPNRVYLVEQIDNFVTEIPSTGVKNHRQLASLILIDLDRFKEVNDTLGHAIGDDLLKAISLLFHSVLDQPCILTRFGGDEFVVWCPDTDKEKALKIAAALTETCRQPIIIGSHSLEIGASIGVALYPEHGQDAENLIKRADIAMYQAKRNHQSVRVYDKDDDTLSLFKVKLSGDISSALQRGDFIIHYQPKVDIKTRLIVGVEALVRWQHPEFGLIYPSDFIGLIEQSGRIHDFTLYVINESVIQIRKWQEQQQNLSIAVNISPYNLTDAELIPNVSSILEKHSIPAQLLEFELTETASMLDIEKTQSAFNQLRELGIKLSIDDFGTGMSSLAYLKELDVDYIKIDRSFIINMEKDHRDKAIVRSTINLISQLGREVIAEGIETRAIAEQLQTLNCRFGQGFYFAKPLPISEINKLLNRQLPISIPNKSEILEALAKKQVS